MTNTVNTVKTNKGNGNNPAPVAKVANFSAVLFARNSEATAAVATVNFSAATNEAEKIVGSAIRALALEIESRIFARSGFGDYIDKDGRRRKFRRADLYFNIMGEINGESGVLIAGGRSEFSAATLDSNPKNASRVAFAIFCEMTGESLTAPEISARAMFEQYDKKQAYVKTWGRATAAASQMGVNLEPIAAKG